MKTKAENLISIIKGNADFTAVHSYNGCGRANFGIYYHIDGYFKGDYFSFIITNKGIELSSTTKNPEQLNEYLKTIN